MPKKELVTAYHEAGHAVVGHFLGSTPKLLSKIPGKGFVGVARFRNQFAGISLEWDRSGRAHMRVQREIMICLAGPIAQRKSSPRSWRRYHGGRDHDTAFELALRIYPDSCDDFVKWLSQETTAIIGAKWNYVEGLAKELYTRQTMTGSQIDETIDALYYQRSL